MLPCLFSAVFSAFKDKSILLVISLDIKTNEVTLNLKDCLKIPKKKSPEKGVAATSLKVKMLDCFMGGFYTWDKCRCFRRWKQFQLNDAWKPWRHDFRKSVKSCFTTAIF